MVAAVDVRQLYVRKSVGERAKLPGEQNEGHPGAEVRS